MKNSCRDNKSLGMPGPVSPAKSEMIVFFRDILDSGYGLRVRVTGKSMVPFLKGGEVVTIKKVPCSELRRGDLIFFRGSGGLPILHRLIRMRRSEKAPCIFQTKGDALSQIDGPIQYDDIMGKVCRIERVHAEDGVSQINMENRLHRKVNYLRAMVNLMKSECYYVLMRHAKSILIRLQSLLHFSSLLSERGTSIR